MKTIFLVVVMWLMWASSVAQAQVCAEPCPCEDGQMDPQTRDEIYTGLGFAGAGYALAVLTQISIPSSPAQRLFGLTPVAGAIDGAVRTHNWEARFTLLFSAGIQVAGILFAATALALHREELLDRHRRVSVDPNGLVLHF